MAFALRLLRPVRASLSVTAAPLFPLPRSLFRGQSNPLQTWIRGLEPVLQNRVSNIQCKLNTQGICISPGSILRMGSLICASVVIGSINVRPRVAHAMDGLDILVDDHNEKMLGTSNLEEDQCAFSAFIKKFWLPVVFLVTVLMNWDHPIVLAAKVILILLGTKPSPLSVYIFVEQFRSQAMLQDPLLHKFKNFLSLQSLHAKKVEVEDYKVLCLARIELRDQKFTLIGILGSWWVLPPSPLQGAFSALSKALKNY
ncbi:uncharacterized protein LOC131168455 isoform X2 [Malania oleifera]|uniref:uncharacterized protein LOC131168455 isoform X2 n=1 Tax=Malania oleifera TaxID=397392 RepID=UPI0025ADDDD4|nr:uncharacterized protein LOC131168455 isoform X2 [Malania oleifera]XP_057983870.1 uncharacterized protein LOC131168455 isoform X2 [Malania oleifera]